MKSMEYLSFTKRERTGIITLVVLLLMLVFSPRFFCQPAKTVKETISPYQFQQLVKKDEYQWAHDTARHYSYKKITRQHDGFNKQYGGRKTYVKQSRKPKIIEINAADTAAFIQLPGIGSKLASRIILFREKLGGFYSVKQIAEVYGLKDSVYRKLLPYLECDARAVKKLHINVAGKDELKQHPYVRWQVAEALVAYREQHGSFDSLSDLGKINIIDSVVLTKMIPYLSLK